MLLAVFISALSTSSLLGFLFYVAQDLAFFSLADANCCCCTVVDDDFFLFQSFQKCSHGNVLVPD